MPFHRQGFSDLPKTLGDYSEKRLEMFASDFAACAIL
jgi:hypothetical protein